MLPLTSHHVQKSGHTTLRPVAETRTSKKRGLVTKTELTTILRWVGQETFARSGTRILILTAPGALSFKLGQVKQHVFVQLTEPCRRNEKTQKRGVS